MSKIFKVGLIGCGHISETYFRAQEYFNNIRIVKCADINMEAAKKCAIHYNIEALTVEELLKDKEIEIILNLTIPGAHYEVSKMALENGKHSYAEKPMAVNFDDGKKLVEFAKEKNLYIGNAIFAFPGVQSYHPNPESWFAENEGGPVIDMGPYYLTALVNLIGPAKQVQGRCTKVFEEREIGIGPKKGQKFKVETPTTYLATIQFENDCIIQITLSFDVVAHQRNHIELYGNKGSIIVPDPNMFGGSAFVSVTAGGNWGEHKTDMMPLGKINIKSQSSRANESPTNANYRGAGLSEMAYAIENKLEHRCNGELSLHVLDIIDSTMRASQTGVPQEIKTTCKKPKPFTLEEIKKILN